MIIGHLAKEHCKIELPLEVVSGQASYYIGTMLNGAPKSRESQECYRKYEQAKQALDTRSFTQRAYL